MKRTGEAGLCEVTVQLIGLRENFGVDQDDGVDGGSVFIKGANAIEVLRDEGVAGEVAGLHGRVDLGNGGFFDVEGGGGGLLRKAGEGGEEKTAKKAGHQTRIAALLSSAASMTIRSGASVAEVLRCIGW